jgi:hypothetical protein
LTGAKSKEDGDGDGDRFVCVELRKGREGCCLLYLLSRYCRIESGGATTEDESNIAKWADID